VTIWRNLYSLTHTKLNHPSLRGLNFNYRFLFLISCRSQRLRGLRRRPAAARLEGWRFRVSAVEWMYLVSVVCVVRHRSLRRGRSPIQRSPTECRVSVCDLEASAMRSPWPTSDCCTMKIVSLISREYRISFGRNWFFSSAG